MLQFLSREREQISSLHSQVATLRVTGAQDYRESIVNWLLVSGSNGSSGCGKWVLPTTAALQIDTSDHYRRCMANVWWWQQWYKWRCHHPSEVANYGASDGPASDYLDDGDTLQWVCNCSRSVCVCVCVAATAVYLSAAVGGSGKLNFHSPFSNSQRDGRWSSKTAVLLYRMSAFLVYRSLLFSFHF